MISHNVKQILREIVEENGAVLIDSEWNQCNSCGMVGDEKGNLKHKFSCVYNWAKKELDLENKRI